jgi:beta-lactamase class A
MIPHVQARVDEIATGLRGRLGCLICDGDGAVWAEHRSGEQFVAASVIKVPILVALAAEVDAGRASWEMVLPANPADAGIGGGVIEVLSPLPYTLKDLATLMIVVSDNHATNRIIDFLGIKRINATFARYGWSATVLGRRMWDWAARQQGRDNLSSPQDTARVFLGILRSEWVTDQTTAEILSILRAQLLHDKLPAWLPFDTIVAHKTGELQGVQNDSGILFQAAGPIIVSVYTNELTADAEGRIAIQQIGRLINEQSPA